LFTGLQKRDFILSEVPMFGNHAEEAQEHANSSSLELYA